MYAYLLEIIVVALADYLKIREQRKQPKGSIYRGLLEDVVLLFNHLSVLHRHTEYKLQRYSMQSALTLEK